LPGHGHCGVTKNTEDINLLFFGDVMAKAVDALSKEEYILAGFSLGANVVAEIMNHSLRPKGIVVISTTIVGGAYTLNETLKEGADPLVLFTDEPTQDAVIEYVHKALLSIDPTDVSICVEDFNLVKKPFRSTILRISVEGNLSNELVNLIQSDVPLFVLFGKEDQFINPNYLDDAKSAPME
jgi:pimeloyl-ACP methyl ester carboxylesterase